MSPSPRIWDISRLEELNIDSEYFLRFLGTEFKTKVGGLKGFRCGTGCGRTLDSFRNGPAM